MSRLPWAGLVVAVFLAGCKHRAEPQLRARLERLQQVTRSSSVESFVALVPPSALVPRCEDLRDLPAPLGPRVVSFIYGEPPEERIAVTLDEAGRVTSYSDLRGDLNVSDGRDGDFTAISIHLIRGHAIAENRPEGAQPQAMLFPLDEALRAASLGEPGRKMREILATCIKS